MRDAFGRKLEYLRLSVTDRCNFRCVYCLPEGCPKGSGEEPLSVEEIERLVRAFAALGVWKVRLTGGEPTLRPDIAGIVRAVAGVPGVRRVGLTTNGYRLAKLAPELHAAGLAALNVSVDSLDAERFARVTGGRLERVMAGVEAALATGIPSVKVNAVLMAGMEDELDGFLDWTRRAAVTVRFIELMETGDNGDFFARHHLSTDVVRRRLEERGWVRRVRDASDGPAVTYAHGDHAGRVGLIAPYAPGFCDSCNRVRVSSTGGLHLCLFGDRAIPLRHYVRDGHHHRDLVELIAGCVAEKPESHLLRLGSSGSTATLAQLGG
jgi:cyclic pyranopterin phosphate synthase